MKHCSAPFLFGERTPKESVGEGLKRQVFGYDGSILMAKVEFDVGAIGQVHSHLHSQVSYVESGEFDVLIDGVEKRLGPGDSFYIQPNIAHGAICRKAGVLIDVFSPIREDFLAECPDK
jgi:quercetin dioxygenase-like cupin family protein